MAPQPQQTKTHFSHLHPLQIITYRPPLNSPSPSSCSGCNLKPSGIIYSCTLCNFFLHKKCFEMPLKITHPSHKEHTFTLLPEPAYAGGVFKCDACGENGNGFSYHCKPCGIDLHILCAAAPMTVTSASHPHNLDLTFGSPYDTKNFACDVCKLQGSDHWLYRCKSCEFDAHLKCARTPPPPVSRAIPVVQPHGNGVPYFAAAAPMQQPHVMMSNPYMGFPAVAQPRPLGVPPMQPSFAPIGFPAGGAVAAPQFGVNRSQNEMVLEALMQMIQNQNAMTQAVLQGGANGVGGGGGNVGMQQLMQLINGNSGLGGGGGGGIPGNLLNAFGGGGGGLDSLQSLLAVVVWIFLEVVGLTFLEAFLDNPYVSKREELSEFSVF